MLSLCIQQVLKTPEKTKMTLRTQMCKCGKFPRARNALTGKMKASCDVCAMQKKKQKTRSEIQ